jgi:hypothetical protein
MNAIAATCHSAPGCCASTPSYPCTVLGCNKRRVLNKVYAVNDADFRQAEKDWYSFVEKITERLTEIDETIPELPVKDVIFRIYRDIRFSKDPTPYSK